MLAMAGAGMAYNQFVEKPRMDEYNRRQGEVAATQTEFSPWTGQGNGKANYQMGKSTIGAGMDGAMAGLSMSQQFDQAAQNKQLADSSANMNNAQADYYRTNTPQKPQQPYMSAWNYTNQNRNVG